MAVRWQREVSEELRSLDTLADPDYTDVVTAPVSDDRPPEQWLRAGLKGTPLPLLVVTPVVQTTILGLRGWKIAARGDNWLRLEAGSCLLTGHVVLHSAGGQLSFATFVSYKRRQLASVIWPPVSRLHRQVAIALVEGAVRSA